MIKKAVEPEYITVKIPVDQLSRKTFSSALKDNLMSTSNIYEGLPSFKKIQRNQNVKRIYGSHSKKLSLPEFEKYSKEKESELNGDLRKLKS